MTTFLPQNQFNSASPPAADEAAASSAPPPPGAAANISVSEGVPFLSLPSAEEEPSATLAHAPSETEAAVSLTKTAAASDICDVPEVFRVANYLCAQARTFVPDYPSIYQAMLDENAPRAFEGDPVWADEAPLFLKSIG